MCSCGRLDCIVETERTWDRSKPYSRAWMERNACCISPQDWVFLDYPQPASSAPSHASASISACLGIDRSPRAVFPTIADTSSHLPQCHLHHDSSLEGLCVDFSNQGTEPFSHHSQSHPPRYWWGKSQAFFSCTLESSGTFLSKVFLLLLHPAIFLDLVFVHFLIFFPLRPIQPSPYSEPLFSLFTLIHLRPDLLRYWLLLWQYGLLFI